MKEPEDEARYEYPEDGPWEMIVRSGASVTYYPRQPSRHPRYEKALPSGRVLIDDLHAGYVIDEDFRTDFEWHSRKPRGRSIKDRGVMRRQKEGLQWFILMYQEIYRADDSLASRTLCQVSEYRGNELVRAEELDEPSIAAT